jgi:hypothetical protein
MKRVDLDEPGLSLSSCVGGKDRREGQPNHRRECIERAYYATDRHVLQRKDSSTLSGPPPGREQVVQSRVTGGAGLGAVTYFRRRYIAFCIAVGAEALACGCSGTGLLVIGGSLTGERESTALAKSGLIQQ